MIKVSQGVSQNYYFLQLGLHGLHIDEVGSFHEDKSNETIFSDMQVIANF